MGKPSRTFMLCWGLLVLTISAAPSIAQEGVVGGDILLSGLEIDVQRFVQVPDFGGNRPRLNALTYTGLPGDDRLFVVDDGFSGRIYQFDRGDTGGTQVATEFFDVGAAVLSETGREVNNDNLAHGGVRGLAFHPDFANNGKFYTSIMEDRPVSTAGHTYISDVASPVSADSVLVEWTYDHGLEQVDTTSYREVFRVGIPVYDHPIKQIGFNPLASPIDEDYGLLYVAHGDGSIQAADPGGGQNSDGRGKIIRIDPLIDGANSYSVPATNPFVGDAGMLDEVYALGFRNPHNLSFADSLDGPQLIVADIGRDNVEEVNIVAAMANHGWSEREGTFVHINAGGGNINGVSPLPVDEADFGFTYPVAQFGHDVPAGTGFAGQAVVGGHVIANGSELDGEYIFGEFATTGRLFHASYDDMLAAITTLDPLDPARDEPGELTQAIVEEFTVLLDHDNNPLTPSLVKASMKDVIDDEPSYVGGGRADLRMGEGPGGELYILNKRNGYIYIATSTLRTAGDGNGDGKVDGLDYLIWAGAFGDNPALDPPGSPENGDYNDDDVVDGLDYLLWATQFGQGPNDAVAVPEPATWALFLLGLSLISIARRR